MKIALGVSMTPTTVGIALVEGEKADGVIVEHDVFEIDSATSSACDHVIAALLGTQEGAIAAGHHLVSSGVTWTDHADAAVLREALVARGIEDVLLVSELDAAGALAQAVGRAMGYDKTALMLIEHDAATLAIVETVDGSVVKVLSQSLHGEDAIAVLTEMVTSLRAENSMPQGMFVVGSGVDVTAAKAHLQDLVSVPVIAPEEPQLALARGAALASANAPRYDATTFGLAYSQDPGDTVMYQSAYPMALAGDATTFLGHDNASADTADIASDPDDVPERSKPSLLVGSSVIAIFVAGMTALVIAMVTSVDRAPGETALPSSAVAPPPAVQSAPAAPPPAPNTVPGPAPSAPRYALTETARQIVPPAPAPVVVRNAAPAPAPPPPVVFPPGIPPAPIIQLPIPGLPPIVLAPPNYNPQLENPPGNPGPKWPRGHGGGGHGGHGGGD